MATRRAAARAKAEVERRGAKPAVPAAKTPAAGRPTVERRTLRDTVVVDRTGKTRDAWFEVLDAFDVGVRGHAAAAAHLAVVHGASPWWAQTLTVEYERARGIRSYAQQADGFVVSAQRALAVPGEVAWAAFSVAAQAGRWQGARHRHQLVEGGRWSTSGIGRGEYRRVIDGRFLRFTWEDRSATPGSLVDVELHARGPDRCTVKLTHRRIRTEEEREILRTHWSWALDSLKSWVETGAAVPREAWLASKR